MTLEKRQLRGKLAGVYPTIVIVDAGDIWALSGTQSDVKIFLESEILGIRKMPDARIGRGIGLHDLGRSVREAVIQDQELPRRVGLGLHAFDGAPDRARAIIRGKHYGDEFGISVHGDRQMSCDSSRALAP